MKGRLYIDGVDAFDRYGVFVAAGGYNGIASWAPLKKVECVDWPDEDGVEPDLTVPVLDSQEIPIGFYASDVDKLQYFFDLLRSTTYHIFKFNDAGCIRKLRLVSHTQSQLLRKSQQCTLTFADDFPLWNYSYRSPVADLPVNQDGYEIDGVPLANYGIYVLQDSDADILKSPKVKRNLLVGLQRQAGTPQDDWRAYYQPKDVKLKCVLRASNKERFWHNYNALLYNLIRPGERYLYAACAANIFPCYYKYAQTDRFFISSRGSVWCEFSFTLVFTSYHAELQESFLVTEDGTYLSTEDDRRMTVIKNS